MPVAIPAGQPEVGSRIANKLDSTRQVARYGWVDSARGLGIILVVSGHVIRANVLSTGSPRWAALHDRFLYSFHMPAFFVLAGLFLWPSFARSRARFLAGRGWAVVYPYVAWSLVAGLIELVFSKFVNSPLTLADLISIPIRPIEQFWFLYVLLICQLLALAVWPGTARIWLCAAAGIVLAAVLGGGWIGIRALYYFPFVALGASGAALFTRLSNTGTAPVVLGLFAWAAFAGFWAVAAPTSSPSVQWYCFGFAGSLGLIGIAMVAARFPLFDPLRALGEASLAIFVMHTIFSAGTRIGLRALGIPPPSPWSIAASLVLGLLCPLLIYRTAVALGVNRRLGLSGPAPSKTPVTSGDQARPQSLSGSA